MPAEMTLNLLDQAQKMRFRGYVTFNCYSEPLLDKRNIMFAREARIRGMKPYLHTNGDILKNNDSLCSKVIDSYDYIVVGLYDYKTNEELETAKQYWQERLSGAYLQFSTIGLLDSQSARSMGIPRALVPTDRRMAVPDMTYINGPCSRPLVRIIIRYDGEMCNCCEDIQGDFKLGNVYQHSLEELWFSDHHVKVVKDLLEGNRRKYELCTNCPQSPTGPLRNDKRIRMVPRHYTVEKKQDFGNVSLCDP